MGKKDKKKGKGAEKTAVKTEKKALQKAKKESAAKGEEDIETLIAEFQERDRQQSYVGEERCEPPTARSGFSLCAHPDKDELLLFGGEFFNGSKTMMYNDLYFYNIKKDQWSILKCSDKPSPRSSQQAVTLSQGGGQLWLFGGEFANPTRTTFHHYKDLWVYHMSQHKWEQVKAPGGPTARSGHRMVACKKHIVIFGGFHESVRDYKYYNDVYVFDLEEYKWSKIEPSGTSPSPRSGFQMAALSDGRILLYGGYTRLKVKKDVDKGISHTDMYYLQMDERLTPPKWKWVSVRQSGIPPSPRSGFSLAVASGNRAFFFGGVHDEDEEEELSSVFHNDLYALEMEKGRWLPITCQTKGDNSDRKRRRKMKGDSNAENEAEGADEEARGIEDLSISEEPDEPDVEIKTSEDSVFTLKIGASSSSSSQVEESFSATLPDVSEVNPFIPQRRMNAGLAIKHNIVYLYGGLYEDEDRQLTLADFYSCDLHKLNEWKTIIASNIENMEWCESEESSSDEGAEADEEDNDGEVEDSDLDVMDTA